MKIDQSDFFKRFKGRITKMDKSGHLGVAMKTNEPIIKANKMQSHRRRNKQQSQLNGNMKSMSLGRGDFARKMMKKGDEIIKEISKINESIKTPTLIQRHFRKNTEILTKRGKV